CTTALPTKRKSIRTIPRLPSRPNLGNPVVLDPSARVAFRQHLFGKWLPPAFLPCMKRWPADNRSLSCAGCAACLGVAERGRRAMGSGRKFALVLLCAMVTGAGWCAARLGGFEWSGIENSATAIWDRVAARA